MAACGKGGGARLEDAVYLFNDVKVALSVENMESLFQLFVFDKMTVSLLGAILAGRSRSGHLYMDDPSVGLREDG